MPLFKHKSYHGGRTDDPHGVTAPAPVRNRDDVYDSVMRGDTKRYVKPSGEVGYKVTINSDSTAPSAPLSKKEQRRKDKGLKELNKPKNRAESEQRGRVYDRARADEARRLDTFGQNTLKEDKQGNWRKEAKGGVAGAYIEGGFEGVKKYDKKTYGRKPRAEAAKAHEEKQDHEEAMKSGDLSKDPFR